MNKTLKTTLIVLGVLMLGAWSTVMVGPKFDAPTILQGIIFQSASGTAQTYLVTDGANGLCQSNTPFAPGAPNCFPSTQIFKTGTVNVSTSIIYKNAALASGFVQRPIQFATGTGCTYGTPAIGATCTVTISIPNVYSDTAYNVTGCTITGATASMSTVGNIINSNVNNFQVTMVSLSAAGTGGGTVACEISHA